MKKNFNLVELFVRYIFLILLGLGNLYIFYFAFTSLTLYAVYFILNIFYNPLIIGTTIIIDNYNIEIIRACVAGSAYYLLVILNFTTPMPLKKRIYSLFYSFAVFLIINVLRIFLLSLILINNLSFFDITHKILWYGLSTIFVIAIWFSEVKIFKIKNIPVYSDLLELKKSIK